MTASPEEHAAVEQLLAERDALHGWLTRLDAASVAAPDAVRERVRRDYQERLEQLTHALREHGETLGARLREDRREHADLAAQATIAREALAEVELRHEVGEFTHERYEADRRRHTSDLETYELSLAAVEERIRRLEEVQAQVNRAPQAPAMEPTLEPEAPELLAEETVGESQDAAAEPAAEDEAAGVIDMDELAPDIDAERVLSIFTEVDEIVEVSADDAVEMEPSDPEAAAAPAPPATATPDSARSRSGLRPEHRPRHRRQARRHRPSRRGSCARPNRWCGRSRRRPHRSRPSRRRCRRSSARRSSRRVRPPNRSRVRPVRSVARCGAENAVR